MELPTTISRHSPQGLREMAMDNSLLPKLLRKTIVRRSPPVLKKNAFAEQRKRTIHLL